MEQFEVRLLCISKTLVPHPGQQIFGREIAGLVAEATKKASLTADSKLSLQLTNTFLRLLKPSAEPQGSSLAVAPKAANRNQVTPLGVAPRPRGLSTSSLASLSDELVLLLEKPYAHVHSVYNFGRTTALVLRRDTDADHVNCYVLRCADKRRAAEVAKTVLQQLNLLKRRRAGQLQTGSRSFSRRRIALHRGPNGFGFQLVGAVHAQVPKEAQGVYIAEITANSSAAAVDLAEGLQIMSIVGIDTSNAIMAEVQSLLHSLGNEIIVEVQENPAGFGYYERQLGRNRLELL